MKLGLWDINPYERISKGREGGRGGEGRGGEGGGRGGGLTEAREAELSTDHVGIHSCPAVVTHGAPLLKVAHLYTTLVGNHAIAKANVAMVTHHYREGEIHT